MKRRKWTEKWIPNIDSVPLQPLLELCGEHRILIENHRGVMVYEPGCIQVRVAFGSLAIEGQSLRLCKMQNQQLVIQGRIDGVRILRG